MRGEGADPERQPAAAARAAAAASLRRRRAALATELAAIVAGWNKYADRHAADPAFFADEEKGAFVDYLARYLETGDPTYRHLIVGERIKQFVRPDLDAAARRALIAEVQAAERAVILAAADAEARPALADALDAIDPVLLGEGTTTLRILFVGDCLYLDVPAFLVPACLERDVAIEASFVASRDPAEERATIARLADRPFDLIFYSPLTYEASPDWARLLKPRRGLRPARAMRREAAAAIAPAAATIDLLAQLFECDIFVHNGAGVFRHGNRPIDRLRVAATARARRIGSAVAHAAIERMVAAANARSIRHVFVFDERPLLARMGAWEAGRSFYTAYLQHPAAFGRAVAEAYARILFVHARLMKRKLVVCDLDNTLWDGVIGEGNGVVHHVSRQRILRRLREKGVVLAINSKNDRAKVVWGDGAFLDEEDFVSSQINWDPKVLNMRRIAEHLNLKPKDFVFVDDRPDERALVSEAFPGLLALDALDAESWAAMDDWATWLPDADSDRTLFYRQRDARREFLEGEIAASEAESAAALAQLGLSAIIREAGEADLARVVELINRTNQFNTAASRVSRADIAAAYADPGARILVAGVADRFGEMGIVSVLVAASDRAVVEIAHFVLSCRVFGYAVEVAMLNAARDLAALPLTGRLVETSFNGPCRSVYADNGFVRDDSFVGEGERWTLPAAGRPKPTPAWLAVTATVTPL